MKKSVSYNQKCIKTSKEISSKSKAFFTPIVAGSLAMMLSTSIANAGVCFGDSLVCLEAPGIGGNVSGGTVGSLSFEDLNSSGVFVAKYIGCLLYTSDAADDSIRV